jgi:TolA-binding protein
LDPLKDSEHTTSVGVDSSTAKRPIQPSIDPPYPTETTPEKLTADITTTPTKTTVRKALPSPTKTTVRKALPSPTKTTVRKAAIPSRKKITAAIPIKPTPTPTASVSPSIFPRLLKQAQELKRRERHKEAEQVLRQALKQNPPESVPFLSLLGQVLYDRNRPKQAEGYLLQAYRINPYQTGDGLVILGSIYYEQGDKNRAYNIYRQYIKFFPKGKHIRDVKAMINN